ncbi:MAG: hypothetical protein ACTHMQ_05540 [Protaetiibacter sp.]
MRSAPRSSPALLPALVLAAAFGLAPALLAPDGASASVGSVPPEVRAYVTGGGLLERLDDIYGEDADGSGIDFDDTTTLGTISRVFLWTEARLAGDTEGKPVRMANEWAVPVTIAEEPVGVAIVWINLDTEQPELAEFTADPDAASALAEVPDAAQLVRDPATGAWFALEADVATPLVAGSSGVREPTPVDELRLTVPTLEPEASTADPGFGLAIAVAAILFAAIVTLLVIQRVRAV